MKITNVSVIGAGTMGNGIAHVFAQYGYQVVLIDASELALESGIKNIEKNIDRQIHKNQLEADQKEASNVDNEARMKNLKQLIK